MLNFLLSSTVVTLGLNFSIRGAHCGLIVLDYGCTDDAGGFDRQEASSEFISVLNQSVRGPQQLHYHLENMLPMIKQII
jgi:hypothetical protein